jgi:uncharacterized protein YgiM (DUF1202 family)
MNNWQYVGTILTGIAALITAGIGIYDKINTVNNEIYTSVSPETKKEYGIVNDKDGWVNLRERPDVSSPSLAKILNGTNLEILDKKVNWYKVYTESGREGYIFKDRLILVQYEQQ